MDYRTIRRIRAAWYIHGHNDSIAFINGIENGIERLFSARREIRFRKLQSTIKAQSRLQSVNLVTLTPLSTASSKYFLVQAGLALYRKVRFRHDCRTGKSRFAITKPSPAFLPFPQNENSFSVYLSAVKLNNFIYTFFFLLCSLIQPRKNIY